MSGGYPAIPCDACGARTTWRGISERWPGMGVQARCERHRDGFVPVGDNDSVTTTMEAGR